jgi:hypothetical protein
MIFAVLLATYLASLTAYGSTPSNDPLSVKVPVSTYSMRHRVWRFERGIGRGWSTVIGDSFDSYRLILEPGKAKDMIQKCEKNVPRIVLNFSETNDKQMRIQLDPSSIIQGKSIQERIKEVQALGKKDFVISFDATASENIDALALQMKFETDPRDAEDFGEIELSFSMRTIDLETFDGDDDDGSMFVVAGASLVNYDGTMPKLHISCRH